MDHQPPHLERARHHLREALAADDPAETDQHLRSILQRWEHDGEAVRVRLPADSSDRDAVSSSIVRAVADRMGVEPTALPERLYDAVDPDALDALFDGRSEYAMSLSFTYCGYRVTATSGPAGSEATR